MIKTFYLYLDKLLDFLGRKKAQKGLAVTIITGALVKVFPDFPQDSFVLVLDQGLIVANATAQIWLGLGIIHQWVKDRLLAKDIIPPSVEKKAEEGKMVVVVRPS